MAVKHYEHGKKLFVFDAAGEKGGPNGGMHRAGQNAR